MCGERRERKEAMRESARFSAEVQRVFLLQSPLYHLFSNENGENCHLSHHPPNSKDALDVVLGVELPAMPPHTPS